MAATIAQTFTVSARTAQREQVSTRATARMACLKAPSKVALSAKMASSMSGAKVAKQHMSVTRATSKFQVFAGRFETERSYIMIKPDGVQRGLMGDVISRFETKGFHCKGLKLFQCPRELAEEHYKDLSEKPFFKDLVDYIISGPVVCMVWEGPGVVKAGRKLIGATNPLEAEPGTIRGDLAIEVGRNVVHGSDSVENGEREIGLWFKEAELVDWDLHMMPWLRE
uniref:Nucleoside diphosphate kinase n=1 Tax=Pyramimonas obovata TaxID=1411642 RepID=A0A7S0R3R2_9CHLO